MCYKNSVEERSKKQKFSLLGPWERKKRKERGRERGKVLGIGRTGESFLKENIRKGDSRKRDRN